MKMIVVPIPEETKAKLEVMRAQGYTINGFVRAALAKALADVKVPKKEGRMKTYFIIVDHVGKKEAWITTKPTRYRKDRTRYEVWGPYNLAAARFNLWGG